jgi:tellurite resistance-related uncharacterized protein
VKWCGGFEEILVEGTFMQVIPDGVVSYKQTPEFNENTIPPGLLKAHQTKAGVWGKIVVREGQLLYRILEPKIEELILTPQLSGVVEPEVLHEVTPLGRVRFYVDFHR